VVRALLAAAVVLVIVVTVVGLLSGVAGAPGGTAAAGPEVPVPVGAFGGLLLSVMGLGALLWRDR